jgi:hypothetical protein
MALARTALSSSRCRPHVGPRLGGVAPGRVPLAVKAPGRALGHGRPWSLGVALALVLLAALTAPEGAADQAAICQRHNGAVACRVW